MDNSGYALEKLSLAVYCLATEPGEVRERLRAAYMEFHPVNENDFPPELRPDWNWIIDQLTKSGPSNHVDGTVFIGAHENTLSRIRKAKGVEIAKRIVDLEDRLRGYLADQK